MTRCKCNTFAHMKQRSAKIITSLNNLPRDAENSDNELKQIPQRLRYTIATGEPEAIGIDSEH